MPVELYQKPTKVLILAIGWEQAPLINRLLEIENLELYAVHYSNDHEDYPFKKVLYADLLDIEKILQFAREVSPDVVMSDQDDFAHFCQALIAEEFNIPGPTVKQAQISSNKFLQREQCRLTGINCPSYELINNAAQVEAFANLHGYPVILKPIDNRGSFGVIKIDSSDEIKSAFFSSIVHSSSKLLIVEQFIVGREVTVDGYCNESGAVSLAIATKQKLTEKLQVSFDIKYPGSLQPELLKRIGKYNEEVVAKLGYNFGMTHGEYIIDGNNEIFLVELANRGGGCMTSELIAPNHSGEDLVTRLLNDCFGKTVLTERKFEKKEVLLKFLNFKEGKVKQINGLAALMTKPNVLNCRIMVKVGDSILPVNSDANRHGFVIVASEKDVEVECEKLIKEISIDYYE